MSNVTTIPAIPVTHNQLLSHSIRSEGSFPKTKYIAVFVYPNCVREYDGERWTVISGKTA